MSYELCCLPDDKCKDTASETRCQVFGDIFFGKISLFGVFPKRFGIFHETWISLHPDASSPREPHSVFSVFSFQYSAAYVASSGNERVNVL